MFLTKTFPKRTYHKVTIKTREKEREIEPQPFNPWSIITHSIKLVLEPVIERLLIYDASARIRGKGQVFAARRIKRLIRRNRGKGWFVDTDLRKFYPSIPHKVAIDALKQHVDDADFIEVFTKVIEGYDSEIEEVLQGRGREEETLLPALGERKRSTSALRQKRHHHRRPDKPKHGQPLPRIR